MPSTRTRTAALVAATALAAGGAGALAVAFTQGGGTKTVTVAQPPAQQISNVSAGLTVGEIASRSTKGVVQIVSTSTSSSPYPFGGAQRSQAEGTGFVYDTSGHIVTNEHVVDGASSVKVTLSDGTTYTATVVGKDTTTDLAVLKVNAPASELKPLALGDSSTVAVGDGVVAIGNPYGLTDSVTSGIVSALNREIQAPDGTPIEGAIQTDAAINHGNSGGPLFDMQGNVIGVTSQIESDTGGNDGIGFAIPSNTVKSIVPQLIANGAAAHPLLGVQPSTAGSTGVKVTTVAPGSGAAKAGLRAGDVITAVNGRSVRSSSALRAAIDAHRPGDMVTVTLERNGSTKTVTVTLGSRPS